MGHKHIETTMIYVHLAGHDVLVEHARYSPVRTLGLTPAAANGVRDSMAVVEGGAYRERPGSPGPGGPQARW